MNQSNQNPEIQHLPEEQKFILELEGDNPGYLEYDLDNEDTLLVMHTEVPAAHNGKGHAARLAKAAMDYVREKGMKVMPYCTYMATFLRRHQAEYKDLFAPEFTAQQA